MIDRIIGEILLIIGFIILFFLWMWYAEIIKPSRKKKRLEKLLRRRAIQEKRNEIWQDEYENRISKDRYPNDWEKRKSFIREKYKYTCQNCNIDLKEDPYYLEVHHTYKVKIEPHNLETLMLLCVICHAGRSTWNREELFRSEKLKTFQNKYHEYLSQNNEYYKKYLEIKKTKYKGP